jgi:hypothetical protein
VDDILRQIPALAHERIQDSDASCTVTKSLQNSVLIVRGLHKCSMALADPAVQMSELSVTVEAPRPGSSRSNKQHIFQHTLWNVGNTCYLNCVMQVIASLPSFVTEIERAPQNRDHAGSSYCLAFLKLFIPVIASPTLSPSSVLEWSSATVGDRQMVQEDWIDFLYRLTTKFDSRYVTCALSDPSDMLEYVLSIVPGITQMCTMDSTWTTTPPCGCCTTLKEILTDECGLSMLNSVQQRVSCPSYPQDFPA